VPASEETRFLCPPGTPQVVTFAQENLRRMSSKRGRKVKFSPRKANPRSEVFEDAEEDKVATGA
jgi:hypothetical protein